MLLPLLPLVAQEGFVPHAESASELEALPRNAPLGTTAQGNYVHWNIVDPAITPVAHSSESVAIVAPCDEEIYSIGEPFEVCDSLDACDSIEERWLFGQRGGYRASMLPRTWWVQGEALLWWPRPMDIPPLVTRGTGGSNAQLGAPGTEILLGGQVLDEMFTGGRLRAGFWNEPCGDRGWQVEVFGIGEQTDRYAFSGTGGAGTAVIGRPFLNVLENPDEEDAQFVSFPGEVRGTVTVEATSQLFGVGVQWLHCVDGIDPCEPVCDQRQIHSFVGWRHLDFDESLGIREDLTSLLPAPDDGRFQVSDSFVTENRFHGADVGMVMRRQRGRWGGDLLLRLALGSNHQRVGIRGTTTVSDSSFPVNNFTDGVGGLLAQSTNIGDYSRDRFSMVPELGWTLSYQLTTHLRATAGYNFLVFTNVVRPGDQIDRQVNPNLFPPASDPLVGPRRPEFSFVETDLWVHGISLGLERRW